MVEDASSLAEVQCVGVANVEAALNVLIDISHPAQVHLFRNVAKALRDRGDQVVIVARDKDVTLPLLHRYGLSHAAVTYPGRSPFAMVLELLQRQWKILRLVHTHKIDFMLGPPGPITHISRLTRAKSIAFVMDDPDLMPLFAKLTYPFADVVATPSCLTHGFGRNHICYEGYHQLAYLHPNHFTPDPTIHAELGIDEGQPFFLLRFVKLTAHHDYGHRGIDLDMRRRIVSELSSHGRVFITEEGELPPEFMPYGITIPPDRIHHALYYATLFIGDSQSMTMEAAHLGVPSIRCNSFVGRISVLNELERNYGLTFGFLPDQREELFAKMAELLDHRNLRDEWRERREKMLKDKVDLTRWILDFLDGYPEILAKYKQT